MTLFYADEQADAIAGAEAVDLFAGPGGWTRAAHELSIREVGLELDRWACATRRAAGYATVECDVSHVDPAEYRGVRGLIASPPCQAFSQAGNKHGRTMLDVLRSAIEQRDWTARPHRDPNVWLALEVGRWADELAPDWIALEQVPAALPLWTSYAEHFTRDGYSTWCGVLNAADYGVPQVRKRAVLLAARHPVSEPPPTHVGRWITMADALNLDGLVGFPRLDDRGDSPDGYRERDWRSTAEPAQTVTEKARSWVVNTGRDWDKATGRAGAQTIDVSSQPAPTFTRKSGEQWHIYPDWISERPATTVQGDPRLWTPGHKVEQRDIDRLGEDEARARYGDRAGTDAIRLTVAQALVLQGFPADYPLRGVRSRQFEQIGNAIPPPLARAILAELIEQHPATSGHVTDADTDATPPLH